MMRIGAACAAAIGAAWFAFGGTAGNQPIAFNHRLHVTQNGMPCEACHEHAADRPHAGLPAIRVCMGCHKGITPKSAQGAASIEAMRALAKQGGDLVWGRVYQLPGHVYFSHQRHTEIAALECTVCHGEMAALTAPPARPIARTLQMDTCLACHESKGITTDCAACHR